MDSIRIDKWLWAARFYKTRALAVEHIDKGRVLINGAPCKPARDVKPGDLVRVTQGQVIRDVQVLGISAMRGPAPVAQALYAETPDSVRQREAAATARRLAPEPADTLNHGRPTKRDRRALQEARNWNDRWSASLDD
ncbi:RNA-binding protein [Comamonas serinivorans]|uniref:RNA-binding protein n=1 Tax=Comamonas serinivorans TaxID=1082851 RepID=A0A1Y0ESS4_9BURK|nr:RNA-binding S4 domain-containing protein [Comamonas serinivorans]ARU06735.1 RNA-binding protein [Comamonas serinivorans]